MELGGAEIILYVSIAVVAVSSVMICWVLWRLSYLCLRLVDEAGEVSNELKGIDSRLTALAKSLISMEALLEREPAGVKKTASPTGSDESRARRKLPT